MTNEQINVAIAEHCGFTDIMWPTGFHQKMSDEKSKQAGGRWRFQIPDYCNDLNAMHEAEKTLNGGKINTYLGYLYESNQAGILSPNLWERIAVRRSTHATSRKRAESFLKTIDKWKEQQ
jgi:hypothetical protein